MKHITLEIPIQARNTPKDCLKPNVPVELKGFGARNYFYHPMDKVRGIKKVDIFYSYETCFVVFSINDEREVEFRTQMTKLKITEKTNDDLQTQDLKDKHTEKLVQLDIAIADTQKLIEGKLIL